MAQIINLSKARKARLKEAEADLKAGEWMARQYELLRMGHKLKDSR